MSRNGRTGISSGWTLLVGVVALVLAVAGGVVAAPERAVADPKADCARTGAVFNNPHTADRDRIHRHIVCLIDGTPAGAELRMAGYHFADQSIVAALKGAIEREVKVKIIVERRFVSDPEQPDRPLFREIQALIGSDKTKDSWAASCAGSGEDGACIGDFKMHNKQFTFSETHGVKNVVLLTSSNFQDEQLGPADNSGIFMWNSGYTVAGNSGLYDWLAREYFADLTAADPTNPQYYEDENLPAGDNMGNYQVYHAPRKSGNTVLEILNKIKCTGSNSGGTDGDHRTIVRASVWAITGETASDPGFQVADRLWQLDNEGCQVDIVTTAFDDDSTALLRSLLRKPRPTGDQQYGGPEVREFRDPLRFGVHEKNLLIDGWYDGSADQKVVLTGSVNFTGRSAHRNDETWLQINDATAHDQFLANFAKVRAAAHTCWQSGEPDGCTGSRSMPEPVKPFNCHETADEYAEAKTLYLYSAPDCAGSNGGKDRDNDENHGDGAGDIKDFDNQTDSIVNTTDRHIEFYNYPKYNDGHPEGDSFCVRPGQWVNQLSLYGDNDKSWSDSISSHRLVDAGDCDRWFGGYQEPNR